MMQGIGNDIAGIYEGILWSLKSGDSQVWIDSCIGWFQVLLISQFNALLNEDKSVSVILNLPQKGHTCKLRVIGELVEVEGEGGTGRHAVIMISPFSD